MALLIAFTSDGGKKFTTKGNDIIEKNQNKESKRSINRNQDVIYVLSNYSGAAVCWTECLQDVMMVVVLMIRIQFTISTENKGKTWKCND
ncbi:CLUMA_CG009731, isoform A [Clunio marinus]|uniref:CLUMA_CG009731, isoform A n=1 Tax=Clunio marinus TaxID=568069 RepID=A0A1J1I7S4_9DIPT|nr:CLUMA_CG009731, isoform A [Clunio marinus]